MNISSALFKTLSENEIIKITDKIYPDEKILRHKLLEGGLFNTTYRVTTEKHDFILRLGPVHRELLLPYEHNLMNGEAEVDRLCALNNIPASKVVFLDTTKTLLDRDIMAVERIESIPLSDPSVDKEAHPEIFRECGVLLKKMHGIKGEKFGRLSNIVAGKGFDSWYEALKNELDELFTVADLYNVYTDVIKEKAYAFLKERKELLNKVTTPSLIHCDLWSGNVLVNLENGAYNVKAIIDGDRAMFGDSYYDIATEWMMTKEFMEGYGEVNCPYNEEEKKEVKTVYSLIQALMDAYIWSVEYDNKEAFERNFNIVKKLLAF